MHHVVKIGDTAEWLGPRRATGRMYENRTCTVDDVGEARVFNTKGAASNSARQAGFTEFTVIPFDLRELIK